MTRPRRSWRPLGPLLPERMRQQRRPRLWQEVAFILLSYWVYSLIRNAVPTHEKPAQEHARTILDAEKALSIDIERTLNHFVDAVHWGGWHWLANLSDYYYAVMHFIVVIAVLVWVYVRHPLNYRSVRTVLYAANGLAAAGFWFYPLAPPRLMTGQNYIDTVVKYHTWGSWGSGDVAKVSNQFAAMPSLHIGWSLWAGITLFMLSRRWWLRTLGLLYPAATFFVIIGTANHFVLDAVGGIVVLALGFGIQRVLTGRPAYTPGAEYVAEPGANPAAERVTPTEPRRPRHPVIQLPQESEPAADPPPGRAPPRSPG
ncbi:MAG TPA: phosphatase PAP2 family protein [Acidothermaceae bacterium]